MVVRDRHTAHIPSIADREQRQQADGGVFGRVERARNRVVADPGVVEHVVADDIPKGARGQHRGRQVESIVGDDTPAARVAPLIAGDPRRHFNRAQMQERSTDHAPTLVAKHPDRRLPPGLRVLVCVIGFDDRASIVEVEFVHSIRASLMQIDRAWMHQAIRAALIDSADECVVVEDDAELAARAGAQADLGGGHSLAGPHRGRFGFVASANSAAQSQLVVLHELAHAVFEIVRPVARVVIRERLFERGAGYVGIEDERIRRIDHRRLGRPAEELAGVRHEPLVELIFARNEHGDARPQGAPGPSRLLPHRRDGPGKPGQHTGIDTADVHPQFERRGGHDADRLTACEFVFDLAPFCREIPRPIRANAPREIIAQSRANVGRDEFGCLATAAERDRAQPELDQLGRHRRRLGIRRRTHAVIDVEQRRIEQRERARTARRSVVGDCNHGKPAEIGGQLRRVADRGRREHERRTSAVDVAHAAQPPQDMRGVGAKYAPQRVELVDNDITQSPEERRPALMIGQQARVHHLGVREHDVGPAARPRAFFAGRITVVSGRDDTREIEGQERS